MPAIIPFNSQVNSQTSLSGVRVATANQQSEAASRHAGSFATSNSLTGSNENDLLILGFIIVLAQLLLQQFVNGQQEQQDQGQQNREQGKQTQSDNNIQESGNQQHQTPANHTQDSDKHLSPSQPDNDERDLTDTFTATDKGLLLDVIGRGDEADTTLNRIEDRNASGNLNDGDNIELQTAVQLENHTFTDEESRNFIEARNPPNTIKLPLSAQQTALLESRYAAEDISIADNNADQQISVGDFLTAFQTRNGERFQLDIPVDAVLIALLNT